MIFFVTRIVEVSHERPVWVQNETPEAKIQRDPQKIHLYQSQPKQLSHALDFKKLCFDEKYNYIRSRLFYSFC